MRPCLTRENVLLLAPLFLMACASPRLVPPSDVADGLVLDAKDRSGATGLFADESFGLGPYRVDKVKRKWEQSSSVDMGNYDQRKTTTGYSYQMTGGAVPWKGVCEVSRNAQKTKTVFGISMIEADLVLNCECTGGAQAARLQLQALPGAKITGTVTPAGQDYAITPLANWPLSQLDQAPGGYRIDGTDGARGALEARPGRIWYTSKLPEAEREPATCALVGLMLFIEPKGT